MVPNGLYKPGIITASLCCSCLRMLGFGEPMVLCWRAPQVTAVSCGSSHSLAILSESPPRLPSMHPRALMRAFMWDQCAKTPPCIAGEHPFASCMRSLSAC